MVGRQEHWPGRGRCLLWGKREKRTRTRRKRRTRSRRKRRKRRKRKRRKRKKKNKTRRGDYTWVYSAV